MNSETEKTVVSNSPDETEKIASNFARVLQAGDTVAFFGDMGAGKTRFAAGICRGLGYRGVVNSPTYAVMNVYEGGRLTVYHFDMYRVTGWDDLENAGFFDCLSAGGVTLTEWSENIENVLPAGAFRITVTRTGDSSREITFGRVSGE